MEKDEGGTRGATKNDVSAVQGDVDNLAISVNAQFERADKKLHGIGNQVVKIENRMTSLEEGLKAALDVLKSIDERIARLPERVERIEKMVLR